MVVGWWSFLPLPPPSRPASRAGGSRPGGGADYTGAVIEIGLWGFAFEFAFQVLVLVLLVYLLMFRSWLRRRPGWSS